MSQTSHIQFTMDSSNLYENMSIDEGIDEQDEHYYDTFIA